MDKKPTYKELEKRIHKLDQAEVKRKRAENALHEGEVKNRALQKATFEALFFSDKGVCIETNTSASRMFGYKHEELIGIFGTDIIVDEFKDIVKERMISGYDKPYEAMAQKKDGSKFWAEFHGKMFDYRGKKVRVTSVRDITERKLAESIIQKERETLSIILESTPHGIAMIDNNGQYHYINSYFTKITGYTLNDIPTKKKWFEKVYPDADYRKKVADTWEKDNIKQGMGKNQEFTIRCKNGQFKHIEFRSTFLKDQTISVLTDITDQKKLEIQLQQSQKMEAIGTLAGGIAHDFNNILFPVLGHTEILMMDIPDDSPTHDRLKKIYSGAIRARDLVKQILTFSRQDSFELKIMKLQPIVKEVLDFIRSTIPTTIKIRQDISSNCGVVKADSTQIHQIIMNLTTNAYHAMEETGGELTVSLKEIKLGKYEVISPDKGPGTYVCLSVADTGVGMDKELTKKIFDPFFTTKEKGKGTGMGLSVVHGIVTSMNGIIQAYSKPGKGTKIVVYFPVEERAFEKQNTQTKEPIQGGTEKILLVDDEEAIVTMEKQMFEHLGYQVTSYTGSIEALEAFRANPDKFDLVITDMTMPNMPGDQFVAELMKIRPDIPILLCTGFSETMSEEKAAALGVKDFLIKPIVMKDFSEKIREVLDNC
ncbi:PAS domain-containing sensor histidine kinase [Desulfobacula sp.]|uniref:PAS domain-containing hybrid sensor histidine kinase/response regulator n=1 Tax=Desulfobacula sp. TaxID=2593537 RepID=UPI0025B8EB0D|nr:PAS domain-containing sensor histidine kinase [Desulfobacula sp.]